MRGRPGAGRYLPPWRFSDQPSGAAAASAQTFSWGNPTLPDLNDATPLILGVKFSVARALTCTGIEWRVPNTAPGGAVTFTLWNFDTQALIRTKTADVTSSAGGLVRVSFDSSVGLAQGTNYTASIFTPDGYTGTANYTWPQTNGDLTADADNGWFVGWPTEVFPNNQSGNDANYHVSPVVV